MTWAPMRASPVATGKVPQQQKRSLPGGRAATIDLDTAAAAQQQQEQKESMLRRLKPPVPVAVVRAPFVILVIMSVITGVVGILVLNTKITENAFKLSAMRREQVQLDQREQQLRQLISNYESPGSLAAAAAKLGLVEAGPPAFIVLPDGRTIGVPKPATGTPSVTSQ